MKKAVLLTNLDPNDYRQETLNGENYEIFPVIMAQEGVMNGILYTQAALAKFAQAWNGVPVPINHPMVDGVSVSANDPFIQENQVVGVIYNAHMDGDKLKAEVWLNSNKMAVLGSDVGTLLRSGKQMDVSTGLFSDIQDEEGSFKDNDYVGIAINIVPDHLALLPGATGACSWADGCGIRANKEKAMKKREKKKDHGAFMINSSLLDNKDYTKIIGQLRTAIDELDTNQVQNYLVHAYSDKIIYRVYNSVDRMERTYSRKYKIESDVVVWQDLPVEVTENITYKPITNKEGDMPQKGEVKTMKECCPDKVDALIKTNSALEDSKEMILGLTEDQFAVFMELPAKLQTNEALETEITSLKAEVEELKINTSDSDNKDLTYDELVKSASPEVQEAIKHGQRVLANTKKSLIDTIKTNESNQFSDEDLKGFDVDMLQKLAESVPVKKDLKTNFGLKNNSDSTDEEDVAPLGMPEEEEK